jgi:hypothetical protein
MLLKNILICEIFRILLNVWVGVEWQLEPRQLSTTFCIVHPFSLFFFIKIYIYNTLYLSYRMTAQNNYMDSNIFFVVSYNTKDVDSKELTTNTVHWNIIIHWNVSNRSTSCTVFRYVPYPSGSSANRKCSIWSCCGY